MEGVTLVQPESVLIHLPSVPWAWLPLYAHHSTLYPSLKVHVQCVQLRCGPASVILKLSTKAHSGSLINVCLLIKAEDQHQKSVLPRSTQGEPCGPEQLILLC